MAMEEEKAEDKHINEDKQNQMLERERKLLQEGAIVDYTS